MATPTSAQTGMPVTVITDAGSSGGSGGQSGSLALSSGVSAGSVTGLGLASVPTAVVVSVQCPSGGLFLTAATVKGSLTTDGFQFILNGATDSANYVLNYVVYL